MFTWMVQIIFGLLLIPNFVQFMILFIQMRIFNIRFFNIMFEQKPVNFNLSYHEHR